MRLLLVLLYLTSQSILYITASECCKDILLDDKSGNLSLHKEVGDRLGFYTQFGEYGGRPVYRQLNGQIFLFYSEQKKKWVDSKYFYGWTDYITRMENNDQSTCPHDSSTWSFYNGTDMEFTEDLSVSCAKIEDVCCHQVRLNSSSSVTVPHDSTIYANLTKAFGLYTAIGTQQGRYMYQMEGEDRFLEYWYGNWLVSTAGDVGDFNMKIYHIGGSICPEHATSGWKIENGDTWKEVLGIKVECERIVDNTLSIVLGILIALILSFVILYFGLRFYKAKGRAARGKRLMRETFLNRSFSVNPMKENHFANTPTTGDITVPHMEGREFNRDGVCPA